MLLVSFLGLTKHDFVRG